MYIYSVWRHGSKCNNIKYVIILIIFSFLLRFLRCVLPACTRMLSTTYADVPTNFTHFRRPLKSICRLFEHITTLSCTSGSTHTFLASLIFLGLLCQRHYFFNIFFTNFATQLFVHVLAIFFIFKCWAFIIRLLIGKPASFFFRFLFFFLFNFFIVIIWLILIVIGSSYIWIFLLIGYFIFLLLISLSSSDMASFISLYILLSISSSSFSFLDGCLSCYQARSLSMHYYLQSLQQIYHECFRLNLYSWCFNSSIRWCHTSDKNGRLLWI